jgi:quercetin dioxygenase-like cupin family protein
MYALWSISELGLHCLLEEEGGYAMSWKTTQLITVVSVLVLAACSKPEPEAVSEPPPEEEAAAAAESLPEPVVEKAATNDPTVADPDRYTAEFENDAVRIVRIRYGAGEESVMHHHPNSVAVFVTDTVGQMTTPDGSIVEFSAAAGDAVFNPAGDHLPRNTSDSAWEVVEVELKQRDSGQAESTAQHASVVDPEHYTVEFENEAVCIVRIKYDAGEESVMHHHPDSVAVFLTDHLVEMTMADGSTEEISAKAGDAIFIPGGEHLPRNISDLAWELVLVELKQ